MEAGGADGWWRSRSASPWRLGKWVTNHGGGRGAGPDQPIAGAVRGDFELSHARRLDRPRRNRHGIRDLGGLPLESDPTCPPGGLCRFFGGEAEQIVATPQVTAGERGPGRRGEGSPTSPLTGGPPPPYEVGPPAVYVLDYDRGVQLFPNSASPTTDMTELATLGAPVALIAQVHMSNSPYATYSWNTAGMTDATDFGAYTNYMLTFQWDSSVSTPAINTLILTVTTTGGTVSLTYSFYVPTTSGTTFSAPGIPQVNPPDIVEPDAPTISTENAQIALQDGALDTGINLPTYNPNVAPLALQYNSLSDNGSPIFIVHYQYISGTTLAAQLTLNDLAGATVYYNLAGLPGPGQVSQYSYVQVALRARLSPPADTGTPSPCRWIRCPPRSITAG